MSALVLPVLLPFPDSLRDTPAGLLPPARLTRHADGITVDRDGLPDVYADLLAVVDAWSPPSYRHGTITGRVVDDPCEPGDWHRDDATGGPDGAVRFAVTIAVDPLLHCGHEFPQIGGGLLSGVVVMFRDDEHRRPSVPFGVRRVFLSVAMYRDGVAPDLSCVGLRPLAVEAVAR